MNLFRQRKNDAGEFVQEAVGGGGTSDIIRIGEDIGKSDKRRLIQVGYVSPSIDG